MHPTGLPQLSHTRIHQRISSLPYLPSAQSIPVFAPGEKGKLLKENLNVDLIFHEDKAIGIELPNQVQFKIKSTDVALKGQTVSSSYKPAILENNIKIQVPPFIESGDEILVDTRTIEYIKKL